jgi:DNA-binding NtrC family response regulator
MRNLDILVVEDGRSQRELLRDFLRDEGNRVSEAEDGTIALEKVKTGYFDLLLVDYKMPGMDGIQLIEAVKALNPEIDIIMMTAYGTIEAAVRAMKAGAADYITKPVDLEELLIQIELISERQTLRKENQMLREELRAKGVTTDRIIYKSSAMEEVVNLAGRVAESKATILLEGKSGTGKELLARLIHHLSPRSGRPMVTVNCMALSESLLESELFGHEKGAFTGASQQRIGRFEEADQSTLFLDEIGEIPPAIQVKLLRFLQEREFQRVGGNRTLRSDVRIIAATNRNLMEDVNAGSFREDLYYRLNVVAIQLPPLRERIEDVPLLMAHFLKHFAERSGRPATGFSAEARDLLMKYSYPGNVRELENIIERAVVICRGNLITRRDLPFHDTAELSGSNRKSGIQTLHAAVENLEKEMIRDAMAKTDGHQTRAAQMLGISERMLRYKLKKYRIKK